MGANRDAANDVYTPIHLTRIVTVAEAAPTVGTDGVDCTGFNVLMFTTGDLVAITDYQYEIYLYNGTKWDLWEDSVLLDVADFDPTKIHQQQFMLSGAFRFALRLKSITGTSIRVTTNYAV